MRNTIPGGQPLSRGKRIKGSNSTNSHIGNQLAGLGVTPSRGNTPAVEFMLAGVQELPKIIGAALCQAAAGRDQSVGPTRPMPVAKLHSLWRARNRSRILAATSASLCDAGRATEQRNLNERFWNEYQEGLEKQFSKRDER